MEADERDTRNPPDLCLPQRTCQGIPAAHASDFVAIVSSVTHSKLTSQKTFVGEMGEESLYSFDLLRTNRVLIAHMEIEATATDSVWWLASRDVRWTLNQNQF